MKGDERWIGVKFGGKLTYPVDTFCCALPIVPERRESCIGKRDCHQTLGELSQPHQLRHIFQSWNEQLTKVSC